MAYGLYGLLSDVSYTEEVLGSSPCSPTFLPPSVGVIGLFGLDMGGWFAVDQNWGQIVCDVRINNLYEPALSGRNHAF
jgi:hypothetical protein